MPKKTLLREKRAGIQSMTELEAFMRIWSAKHAADLLAQIFATINDKTTIQRSR